MSRWPANPGSQEAVDQGCTCAIIDNCYGKGIGKDGEAGRGWWISGDCPLHGTAMLPTDKESDQ